MINSYAWKVYRIHKEKVGSWKEGQPVKSWMDEDSNLCVAYESGKWWHYTCKDGKTLEWW